MLLAIDLGTSRIKVGHLDGAGGFRLLWSAPAPMAHPQPGAAEHDPRGTVALCLTGLRHCAGADLAVEALVLTGQMGGLVLIDRQGRALSPWFTSMDTRCRAAGQELRCRAGARVRRLCASAPLQAERLSWACRTGPGAWRDQAALALLLGPYVATQLAAEGPAAGYCERTCLGWTGLADVEALRWDGELADAAGWPVDRLPRIVEPGTAVGTLSAQVAATAGLPAGLPLIAGPGDQAASYYGAGCLSPGDLADSASTFPVLGGVSVRYRVPANPRVELMPAAQAGLWHPLVYLLGSGSMPGWFAGAIAGTPLDQLEREAEALPDAAGVIAVPYGSPVGEGWSESVFWGAGPAHGRAHVYRALLEGLACEYALLAGDLAAEGLLADEHRAVLSFGGGNASPLLRRLKAAALNAPLHCLATEEMALAGATLFVAQAGGRPITLRAAAPTVVEPDPAEVARFQVLMPDYRRLRTALAHRSGE